LNIGQTPLPSLLRVIHEKENMMDKDKAKGSDAGAVPGMDSSGEAIWRYETPQQDAGAGTAQSNSAHYTGGAHGGDAQQGDFLPSPPDANAMPAGEPQTSRGSAAGSGGVDTQGGNGPGAGAPGTNAAGLPGAGGGGGGGGAGGGGSESIENAGAGAGKTPGAPGGNGSKDEPIWGS
jgi:hypothetical protein